jgi:CheY-like chemotaxis protein
VDKVVLSAQLLKVVKRALYRATESSLVTIRMQVLEEALHPAQALGNSMRKQPPSDGGLVCISVSLVTPLSEEEKLMFSEGKLQFAREARDCDGCSALSMWLAKKSFMLHGGRLRLETNTDGEVLCMDLPFERTPIPMLPLALKSLKTKFAGMMLSKARKQSDNPLPTFSLQLPKTRRSILKMNANTVTAAGLTADFKLIVCPTSTPVVEDRKRLLVVDDSEMNRKMVIRLMTSLGYTCDEAEDGSIAHKMVVESMQGGVSYEFVLMDNGK